MVKRLFLAIAGPVSRAVRPIRKPLVRRWPVRVKRDSIRSTVRKEFGEEFDSVSVSYGRTSEGYVYAFVQSTKELEKGGFKYRLVTVDPKTGKKVARVDAVSPRKGGKAVLDFPEGMAVVAPGHGGRGVFTAMAAMLHHAVHQQGASFKTRPVEPAIRSTMKRMGWEKIGKRMYMEEGVQAEYMHLPYEKMDPEIIKQHLPAATNIPPEEIRLK